jgi:antitoxin ParD1/3/4
MNVSLTPELERFVLTKVKTGRYNSASEVVREALRLLEDHEETRSVQLRKLRAEVDRRIASLDRGEGVDGEAIFASLGQRTQERRKKPG